jgi:hypothetical protein
MAPMPICSVAPSSTRSAMISPMRASTSVSGAGSVLVEGPVGLHEGRRRGEKGTTELPVVRGMRSLISRARASAPRRGGPGGVDGGAERAQPVGVGRRELHERHVEGMPPR